MEVIYRQCCGLDVHKKVIVACLWVGHKKEIREYGTTTSEIRQLAGWVIDADCEMVAMESTGVYWKPAYNFFEFKGLPAIVVNAQHMKNLPGHKTDVKDAEWIADLLRHGLLKASYIPDREQRELRDLTRYRKSLIEERAREVNRLEKTLEEANIKLSSIVSDITGKSSRKLLDYIIADDNPTSEDVNRNIAGSMRKKLDMIMAAIDGFTTPVQCKLMGMIISHIDDMTRRISEMDAIIRDAMKKYDELIETLDQIPGIVRRSAEIIIAEIGPDMSCFPTDGHLSSWGGLSPGNNQSTGKRRSGRATKENVTLKATLVICAKSVQRVKETFFAAQYHRIAVRRWPNRAALAVANSILIAIYHVIKDGVPFNELGAAFYDKFNRERKTNGHLKKLKELGWTLPVAPVAA